MLRELWTVVELRMSKMGVFLRQNAGGRGNNLSALGMETTSGYQFFFLFSFFK